MSLKDRAELLQRDHFQKTECHLLSHVSSERRNFRNGTKGRSRFLITLNTSRKHFIAKTHYDSQRIQTFLTNEL